MKRRLILVRDLEKTLYLLLIIGGLVSGSSVALGGEREFISYRPYFPASMTRGTYYMNGADWLEGWTYRKSHTIQGSPTGSVTNYPILFKVHYSSSVDSGADIYLNYQSRSDFGDLRFTGSDGQTELAYWMEEKVDGDYARFWVNIPSIPASPRSTTIYLYYGKTDATTTSNGNAVFSFLETWETSTGKIGSVTSASAASGYVNDWYFTTPSFAETNSAPGYIGNARYVARYLDAIYYWGASGNLNRSVPLNIPQQGVEFYYKYTHTTGSGTDYQRVWVVLTIEEEGTPKYLYYMFYTYNWEPVNDATNKYIDITGESPDTWHRFVRDIKSDAQGFATGNIVDMQVYVNNRRLNSAANTRAKFWIDQIKFRKYVSPEPSYGGWGSEEGGEAPTVMVLSPNGGEAWKGIQPITWEATDPQDDPLTYTVSYSPNGGASWTQLTTGLTESSYAWDTTTVVDGVNYLVKVEAWDGEYTGTDVSDTPFEIANAPPITPITTDLTTTTVPPIIPVTTYPANVQTETVPYGGYLRLAFFIDPKEDWWVKWSFSGSNPEVGIKAMVMEFGESFKFVQGMSYNAYTLSEGKTSDSGTFTIPYTAQWAFMFVNLDPSQQSTTLTVTLQLIETAIKPPNSAPTVRVLRPNGGERVEGTYTLEWEATDPDGDALTFTISYSPNGGQTWTQLARGLTGTFYLWDTSRVQVGTNYLIKVEASDGTLTADDRSDAPFKIEREVATETEGVFIPSFGILEALGAFLILIGLGKLQKKWIS